MLISAIAIIVMAICAMVLFYDILKKQLFDDLKANAHVISMMKPEDLPDEINYNLNKDGLRITLINEDGTVIYDSMEDESKMENHRERPEIVSALAAGEGRAMRKSTTSAKHTFYYAMRTDDGKVLRIGKDSNSIYSLIIKMVYLTLSVGFCVFVLCTVLAHRLTKRLVAPIEKMADNIVLLEENDVYDEMKPFVATIKQQHVDILKHSQMRQEFTANVSHELKTPLQGIIGSADLIETGMVKPEDMPRFIGHIRKEATRLVALIEDINRLSQLDEGNELPCEKFDLMDIAEEVEQNLESAAGARDITLSLSGRNAIMHGVRRLMYEIVYNLCDNAIKYNLPGGKVEIMVDRKGEEAVLCVKDNGIGIAPEHQDRVFERFYRVDKSHSKSSGGTGLGLSIVKHAVQYHHGKLELKSEIGKGTEITVHFPIEADK